MDNHEWIARAIRTVRLKAQGAGRLFVSSSMEAPAEDADLLAADVILCGLAEPDITKRKVPT
jgi:hypothetical protein